MSISQIIRGNVLKGLLVITVPLFIVSGFFVFTAHAATTWNVSVGSTGACTAEDSNCATIQAAITAATSGDTIQVAAGTYAEPIQQLAACGNEKASLCLDKSLTLRGDPGDTQAGPGLDAPVLDGSGLGNGSAIALLRDGSAISNVTIEGFVIRNYTNPSGQGGVGSGVIAWDTQATNVTVQNNRLENLGWNGVLVGSKNGNIQTGWTIQRNIILSAGYAGVELTNVTNSTVSNNTITVSNGNWDTGDSGVGVEVAVRDDNEGTDEVNNGVDITAGTGVVVSGNTITGGGAGARAGINILSRAYLSVSNAVLTGVTIQNNTITGVEPTGIRVEAEERNNGSASLSAAILGNTLSGGGTADMIRATDVTSLTINGATIADSIGHAINVIGGANVMIEDVTIGEFSASAPVWGGGPPFAGNIQSEAIRLVGVDGATVNNVDLSENDGFLGVNCGSDPPKGLLGSTCVIQDSTITANWNAVYVTGDGGNATITGNTLLNAARGIRVDADFGTPVSVVANNNTITGNTGAGVNNAVSDLTVDAHNNWWGVANPDFSTLVSGDVTTSPVA